jgi:hypothetical protein
MVGVKLFLLDLIKVFLAEIFSEEVTDLGLFEGPIWLLSLAEVGRHPILFSHGKFF